jgi:hypothetical protein
MDTAIRKIRKENSTWFCKIFAYTGCKTKQEYCNPNARFFLGFSTRFSCKNRKAET